MHACIHTYVHTHVHSRIGHAAAVPLLSHPAPPPHPPSLVYTRVVKEFRVGRSHVLNPCLPLPFLSLSLLLSTIHIDTLSFEPNVVTVEVEKIVERVVEVPAVKVRYESVYCEEEQVIKFPRMTHQSRTEVPYVQEMYSFDEIVKAMMSQLDDAKVQEIGLRTLWNLSCNHPDSQVEILKQGIDLVVKVMLNHLMTARVQWLGCGALCSFACNNAAVQVEIARKGGIEAVVKAISTHIDNEGVQELGCGALTSLACSNTTTQMSIVMLGCVDHVVNGMARHLNSESVQQQGCGALASLSSKNAVAQVEIGKKGGFQAVVSAMMNHPENARVQGPHFT